MEPAEAELDDATRVDGRPAVLPKTAGTRKKTTKPQSSISAKHKIHSTHQAETGPQIIQLQWRFHVPY